MCATLIARLRLFGVVTLLIFSACRQRKVSPPADSTVPRAPVPTSSALDPRIAFVVTGGSWKRGEQSGDYRIVVRNGGYEHISSRVSIEWLEADPDSGVFVRASRELDTIPEGVYSIGLPGIEVLAGRSELILSGTSTHENSKRSWRFLLGEPNVVRTLSDSAR